MSERPKIAFFFRYSPADHTELSPAVPALIQRLAQSAEVHYFGMGSRKPVPALILQHAIVHLCPFKVDRSSSRDKFVKTLLWYLWLPWIGLRCRFSRMDVVYFNDYLPLGAWFVRLFYGRNYAYWVADFLHHVYAEKAPWFKPVATLIDRLDFAAWRGTPLIFTHARATIAFLEKQGIPASRIIPVHDPCDTTLYRPVSRADARHRWDYREDDFVLVHHGILHPNKGIDRVINTLAPLISQDTHLHFLIVGSGPELSGLKALTARLGLTRQIRFTGWLESLEEVNLALNAGNVGLVMRTGGIHDDFHTTSALVHNMAAGLAILSVGRGGMAEVVTDGQNGFLFDPDNMTEFTTKLLRLRHEPELRRTFGTRARELACALFSIESVVARISAPLLELARNKRPPPPTPA
jgi:glycosyltransferase involved in cell wall biosynthesis